MAIADPVSKSVRIKKESAWGTAAGTSGGQVLRRVSSDIDLRKQTYESSEIRTDYQVADFRHGVRSVEGRISGELSPLTYEMIMVAATRKAWAATSAITGLSITIAASGSYYTITRGAGDFMASGVKIGDVVRLTAGTFTAGNLNNNLVVVDIPSAAVLKVSTLNGSSLTAEGPIASATVSVTGKKTWVPTSSHTDDSFTIEHWFSDITQSEVFTGCKVQSLAVSLPPSGMATIDAAFMGKDITTGTTAYFTGPTAITSSGVLAAVNGILRYGTGKVANITGLNFTIDGGMSAQPVVGSNVYPDIFAGMVRVSGQFSAFFEDATYRDAFLNETEGSLTAVLSTGFTGTADFVGFTFPRVKLGGASKSDGGTGGIVLTVPFTALYNSAGGTSTSSEQTTMVIQDSLAP
jgi:hypothetical protein